MHIKVQKCSTALNTAEPDETECHLLAESESASHSDLLLFRFHADIYIFFILFFIFVCIVLQN